MSKEPYSDDLSKLLAILPEVPHGRKLKKAQRRYAYTIARKGGDCPCCGRFGKVNAHGLTRAMTATLIWICKQGGINRKWVNVQESAPKWLIKVRQTHKLAYWGLVVKRSSNDPKKKDSGYWRITKLGMRFLREGKKIPKRVFIYKKQRVGYSNEKIHPTDVYEDFDFQKAMRTHWLDEVEKK